MLFLSAWWRWWLSSIQHRITMWCCWIIMSLVASSSLWLFNSWGDHHASSRVSRDLRKERWANVGIFNKHLMHKNCSSSCWWEESGGGWGEEPRKPDWVPYWVLLHFYPWCKVLHGRKKGLSRVTPWDDGETDERCENVMTDREDDDDAYILASGHPFLAFHPLLLISHRLLWPHPFSSCSHIPASWLPSSCIIVTRIVCVDEEHGCCLCPFWFLASCCRISPYTIGIFILRLESYSIRSLFCCIIYPSFQNHHLHIMFPKLFSGVIQSFSPLLIRMMMILIVGIMIILWW